MGIYIKNMDMPTSCADCKLRMVAGCCGNLPHNTRMPNCPLVPIPPHGRLIDADALLSKDRQIYRSDGAAIGARRYIEFSEIDDAPTVIPESEEGE